MIDALSNGRNLTLMAPRRMGKTGLIKHLFYTLNEAFPEIITLHLDIFSTQNLNDFVRVFASSILGQLDDTPEEMIDRVTRFITCCYPQFSMDPITGKPQATIEIPLGKEEEMLKELFHYLQSSKQRVYIAIDEFQHIADYPEKGVEAMLRSFIQFSTNTNYIFSGSKQRVMQEMFLSAKRPFYQSTQTVLIDCIDEASYYSFASSFFTEQGFELSEETFSLIYDTFEGHTWYIQAILNRLYSYHRPIDSRMVHYAINEIVGDSSYVYETLIASFTATNVKLLKAIAGEGCVKEINSGEFIVKYKFKAASSINTALKKLLDKEMVCQTRRGYIIYDRFLSIWLRQLGS